MKYSLRSLMIVAIFLPPLLAVGWGTVRYVTSPREPERAETGSGTHEEILKYYEEYEKYLESHRVAP